MSAANRLLFVLWLLATAILLVLAVIGADETTRLYYSNACQVLVSLGSAMVCFATARAFPKDSAMGKVWVAIASGVFAWGLGALVFATYPLLNAGEDTPFPYWSDIGYLLTSPLIAIGLLLFKREAGLESPMWGKAIALAALAITGYIAWQANSEGILEGDIALKLASFGYFAFDPILLAVTLLTASAFSSGDVARSWWLALGGILAYFVGNLLYNYMVSTEQYTTGSPIDAFWLVGFGLIAVAAAKARKLLG
jgi:hypothetical protein